MEGRGRHHRLSPFVQPKSLPRAPWSVNVTTPRERISYLGLAATTGYRRLGVAVVAFFARCRRT